MAEVEDEVVHGIGEEVGRWRKSLILLCKEISCIVHINILMNTC